MSHSFSNSEVTLNSYPFPPTLTAFMFRFVVKLWRGKNLSRFLICFFGPSKVNPAKRLSYVLSEPFSFLPSPTTRTFFNLLWEAEVAWEQTREKVPVEGLWCAWARQPCSLQRAAGILGIQEWWRGGLSQHLSAPVMPWFHLGVPRPLWAVPWGTAGFGAQSLCCSNWGCCEHLNEWAPLPSNPTNL